MKNIIYLVSFTTLLTVPNTAKADGSELPHSTSQAQILVINVGNK